MQSVPHFHMQDEIIYSIHHRQLPLQATPLSCHNKVSYICTSTIQAAKSRETLPESHWLHLFIVLEGTVGGWEGGGVSVPIHIHTYTEKWHS